MLQESHDRKESFFDRFDSLVGINRDYFSGPFKSLQQKAHSLLLASKSFEKEEAYRGFPCKKLSSVEFVKAGLEDFSVSEDQINAHREDRSNYSLIISNGRLQLSQSNLPQEIQQGLQVSTLKEAEMHYGPYLCGFWEKLLKTEKDFFYLLNLANFSHGVFLYLPPKLVLDKPLEILHFQNPSSESSAHVYKFFMMLGAHSKAKLLFKDITFGEPEASFVGMHSYDVIAESGSECECNYLSQSHSTNQWSFSSFRGVVKENASLNTFSFNEANHVSLEDYKVVLEGENSSVDLSGIGLLSKNRRNFHRVFVEHAAPGCTSSQLFRNVLQQRAYSDFSGKIYVHPQAQQTQAYQLNNNLVLSDDAKASSKPHLEIFADDVKASHGSTIGKLDSEQILYLRTRGIPEKEASRMLIKGFLLEVFNKSSISSVQKKGHLLIERNLSI